MTSIVRILLMIILVNIAIMMLIFDMNIYKANKTINSSYFRPFFSIKFWVIILKALCKHYEDGQVSD